jgi:hypothetical protein
MGRGIRTAKQLADPSEVMIYTDKEAEALVLQAMAK